MGNEFQNLPAGSEQGLGDSELRAKAMLASSLLGEGMVGKELTEGDELELVIRIDEKALNVREFAAFLEMLDGVYGRLDPIGFRSYAQRRDEQLFISKVRAGSLEIIIPELAKFLSD